MESIKWESTYDTLICDGTQWTLDAEFKGVNIHCYGSNAYPPDFKVFLKRLNKVIEHERIRFWVDYKPSFKIFLMEEDYRLCIFMLGFQYVFYHFQSIARLPKLLNIFMLCKCPWLKLLINTNFAFLIFSIQDLLNFNSWEGIFS